MRHPIVTFMVALMVMLTAGCGFHLQGTTSVPRELKTLIIDSSDPYGPLTRAVRTQLRLNGVTIVNDNANAPKTLPSLRLGSETIGSDTASVFQDGKAAEYQMVMRVTAQVLVPNKGIFPISVTVFRSFFDNPLAALAKDSEQSIIIDEMRTQAADKLVRNLLAVHAAENEIAPARSASTASIHPRATTGPGSLGK